MFVAIALFLAIVIDSLFVIEEIAFFKPLYNLPDGGLFSLAVKFVKKFGVFVLFLVGAQKDILVIGRAGNAEAVLTCTFEIDDTD